LRHPYIAKLDGIAGQGSSTEIDIFLQPGEFFVGDASFRVRTVLGSCVSITLWHARHRVGAMSHFLLPYRLSSAKKELEARYGEDALVLMLDELSGLGVRAGACKAKIFGGGDMFPGHTRDGMTVGKKNGEAARSLLARHGIPIVSESLFGNGHRQIIFDISTGDVWARQAKLTSA
jgi:chemotaxis protein CheD